jgi:hypothetical protein
MKKGMISLLLLLLLPIVYSQDILEPGEDVLVENRAGLTPDSPLYALDTLADNINIAVRTGSSKQAYMIKVKNERVAEAAAMANKGNSGGAKRALGGAASVSSQLTKGFSLKLMNESEESVEFSESLLAAMKEGLLEGIEGFDDLMKAIDEQMSREEKIRKTKELVNKIADYCNQLAMQDYDLMKSDFRCDPSKAPDWLREYIDEEIKGREEQAKQMMIEHMTVCVMSPRECDCSVIPVQKHRQECEENTELAIACEYNNDMSACRALESKPIVSEDIPAFLRPFFESTMKELIAKKSKEMFEKFAPPECVDAGLDTPEDCFALMKSIYGTPPECEGLSDEECMEIARELGPPEEGMPPECQGMLPSDCAKVMIEKYGMPRECEEQGLGIDECADYMRTHEPEMPPECEGLSPPECQELMRSKIPEMPEECEGLSPEECEGLMKEKMREEGRPEWVEECEGLSVQECMETVHKEAVIPEEIPGEGEGRPGETLIPEECEGLTPEECAERMREMHAPQGTPVQETPTGGEISIPEGGTLPEEVPSRETERGMPLEGIKKPFEAEEVGEEGSVSESEQHVEKEQEQGGFEEITGEIVRWFWRK